jgi:large subunit ribosomal protein L29
MQHATQQLGKTSELRKVKRDIARVRTIATELAKAAPAAKPSGKA